MFLLYQNNIVLNFSLHKHELVKDKLHLEAALKSMLFGGHKKKEIKKKQCSGFKLNHKILVAPIFFTFFRIFSNKGKTSIFCSVSIPGNSFQCLLTTYKYKNYIFFLNQSVAQVLNVKETKKERISCYLLGGFTVTRINFTLLV